MRASHYILRARDKKTGRIKAQLWFPTKRAFQTYWKKSRHPLFNRPSIAADLLTFYVKAEVIK